VLATAEEAVYIYIFREGPFAEKERKAIVQGGEYGGRRNGGSALVGIVEGRGCGVQILVGFICKVVESSLSVGWKPVAGVYPLLLRSRIVADKSQ
jgi:hypothetical protein